MKLSEIPESMSADRVFPLTDTFTEACDTLFGHAAEIEQIVGANTAAVVLALAFDLHTYPKCPVCPQFLQVVSRAGQHLLL